MFLSGILPISSAVMTSMMLVEARCIFSDSSTDCRMPVTTISSSGVSAALSAKASVGGTRITNPNADLTANAIRFI